MQPVFRTRPFASPRERSRVQKFANPEPAIQLSGENMKVWISFDMEGVAGIVDWEQCRPGGGESYALGCALLQDEVNAAINGAIAGGATAIVLNDSHGRMANLDPRKIAGDAQYISGRHKPY
jgi:D-amino peptidase